MTFGTKDFLQELPESSSQTHRYQKNTNNFQKFANAKGFVEITQHKYKIIFRTKQEGEGAKVNRKLTWRNRVWRLKQ